MNKDILFLIFCALIAAETVRGFHRHKAIRRYGALYDCEIVYPNGKLMPYGAYAQFTFEGELLTIKLREAVFFFVKGEVKVLYHPKYPDEVLLCLSRDYIISGD